MLIQGLAPIALALFGATLAEQEIENYQLWWDGADQSTITKASCDSASTSIVFSLLADSDSPAVNANGELYIWWPEANDDDCTSPEDDSAVRLIDGRVSEDGLGYLGDTSFEFPSEAELTFTYETVYSKVSDTFCDEGTQTERTKVRLCIGIEHPETDLTGNATERDVYIDKTSELQVGVDFLVDSVPPSTPTISEISPLDGTIQFTASIDEETPYLREWIVRYQEDDGSGSECADWTTPQEVSLSVNDSETKSQKLSFTATNGVDFSFCVIAVDDAGNQSSPSDVAVGTARDECDFLECYPGELETGHCGAANRDILWLIFATLLALRLHRSRRPQSC